MAIIPARRQRSARRLANSRCGSPAPPTLCVVQPPEITRTTGARPSSRGYSAEDLACPLPPRTRYSRYKSRLIGFASNFGVLRRGRCNRAPRRRKPLRDRRCNEGSGGPTPPSDGHRDIEVLRHHTGLHALIEPLGAGSFPGQRSRGQRPSPSDAASMRKKTYAGWAGEGAGGQGPWGAGDRSPARMLLVPWPGASRSWREGRRGLATPRQISRWVAVPGWTDSSALSSAGRRRTRSASLLVLAWRMTTAIGMEVKLC